MNEEQYQEPDFVGFPHVQPTISDEFSKWQLWGEDLLEQLKHDLRGEKFDPDKGDAGEWIIPEHSEPMMNEKGVSATISFIRSVGINKFAMLSKTDKETIYKMLQEVTNELTLLYFRKHEDYGIQDPITAGILITQIFYFLQNALLMADEAGMRDYLKTQVREVRSFRDVPEERKKSRGLFGIFGRGED